MSYGSKRTLASMVAGIVVVVGYFAFAMSGSAPRGDDLSGWARAMLLFVGGGVGLVVVAQIVFHIGFAVAQGVRARNESEADSAAAERSLAAEMVEDERVKLISQRSARTGQVLAGLGLAAALALWAAGGSAVVGLHVLVGAFAAGSLLEGVVAVFFYEKGLGNA